MLALDAPIAHVATGREAVTSEKNGIPAVVWSTTPFAGAELVLVFTYRELYMLDGTLRRLLDEGHELVIVRPYLVKVGEALWVRLHAVETLG